MPRPSVSLLLMRRYVTELVRSRRAAQALGDRTVKTPNGVRSESTSAGNAPARTRTVREERASRAA